MSDSKKSPDKKFSVGKIIPSIDEINKIDVDDSKDENKEDNNRDNEEKNNGKDSEKGNEEKYFEEGLPIGSKFGEFLSNDFKKKFSLLVIAGFVLGIILIILGISLMLGDSENVVDHVAFGETASSSIFVIILGAIILGISLIKLFQNTGSISNTIGNLDDLTLLDEDDYDEKDYDENKLNELDSSSEENNSDLEEINESEDSYNEHHEIIVEHEEIIVEHENTENSEEIIVEHENTEEINELKDSDEENTEIIVEHDAPDDLVKENESEEKEFMNSGINGKTSTKDYDNTLNNESYPIFDEDFDSNKSDKEITLFDFY